MKGSCMEIEPSPPSNPCTILVASIYDIQSVDKCWLGNSARAHSAYAAGPMEAAQANVYHAPASRDRFKYIQFTHLRRSAGRRCLRQRLESALDAHRLRNRGQVCETRRDNVPLDMRAIPKAPLPCREEFCSENVHKKDRY